MSDDRKTVPASFGAGEVVRTPQQIAADPTLSKAGKIEMLKSVKEHHAGPGETDVLRAADLELQKLLELDSRTDHDVRPTG